MKYPDDYMNKVICGDCLEVMKDIPDKSMDLVWTDPPYNVGKKYGVWNDDLPIDEYLQFTKDWILQAKRISNNIGGDNE